jgi:hypothetical protein
MNTRLIYLFFALALLVPSLSASAQSPTSQVYIPQVTTGPRFEPDPNPGPPQDVGSGNNGYANLYCLPGQRANHTWYVNGPGYMRAQWLAVNMDNGELRWYDRSYYASGEGWIHASMWPVAPYAMRRVSWGYTGIAVNWLSSCGSIRDE